MSAPSAAGQGSSGELAAAAAPAMIRARYRKVRKQADLLTPESSVEAYHEVRGRAKKLRYALEAVAVIYGKPADEMIRALRRWQEKLGVQQDAAVAMRRLESLAGAPPKGTRPRRCFLMGRWRNITEAPQCAHESSMPRVIERYEDDGRDCE